MLRLCEQIRSPFHSFNEPARALLPRFGESSRPRRKTVNQDGSKPQTDLVTHVRPGED